MHFRIVERHVLVKAWARYALLNCGHKISFYRINLQARKKLFLSLNQCLFYTTE